MIPICVDEETELRLNDFRGFKTRQSNLKAHALNFLNCSRLEDDVAGLGQHPALPTPRLVLQG